jgi:hypothetical protein
MASLVRSFFRANDCDGQGNTALHIAAYTGNVSLLKVKLDFTFYFTFRSPKPVPYSGFEYKKADFKMQQ